MSLTALDIHATVPAHVAEGHDYQPPPSYVVRYSPPSLASSDISLIVVPFVGEYRVTNDSCIFRLSLNILWVQPVPVREHAGQPCQYFFTSCSVPKLTFSCRVICMSTEKQNIQNVIELTIMYDSNRSGKYITLWAATKVKLISSESPTNL